ncbi:MAG: hypothetical protein ABFC34_13855 [Methanobacterium sp.]
MNLNDYILIIIPIIIAILNSIRFYKSWLGGEVGASIAVGVFTALVSFAIMVAILWILPAQTETIKSTNQLICLQDNTQTNGSFFLGSGTIEDEQVFTFYVKQKYGYKLKYVNAKKAIIIYSNKAPKIVKYLKQTKKTSIGYDFPDSLVKIYIPYNSIQNNFQLDAK